MATNCSCGIKQQKLQYHCGGQIRVGSDAEVASRVFASPSAFIVVPSSDDEAGEGTSQRTSRYALLADTKTLLAHWNTSIPAQVNLERLRRENVFGKVSRSRVTDVLSIFRQRVLGEESVTKALIMLVRKRLPAPALDRILYFHAAQADQLLHDIVVKVLVPLQARGISQIDVLEIQRPLKKWVDAGKTRGKWSDPTMIRIALSRNRLRVGFSGEA
jgi:hypothetical protein